MKLTRQERLILSLQYRILERLSEGEDEADYYRRCRDAVECGYEFEYSGIAQFVYEKTLSEAECGLVWDVLIMFDALQNAHRTLANGAGVSEQQVSFPGFDGNTETAFMAYARFILEDKTRFASLKRPTDVNSHSPEIEVYQRMLRAWEASAKKYELTAVEVKRIMTARIHPENKAGEADRIH